MKFKHRGTSISIGTRFFLDIGKFWVHVLLKKVIRHKKSLPRVLFLGSRLLEVSVISSVMASNENNQGNQRINYIPNSSPLFQIGLDKVVSTNGNRFGLCRNR